MTGQYLCGTCKIEVKNEDKSVQCNLWDKWNHVFLCWYKFCYEKLKLITMLWYCPICANEMPFSSLSNKEFNIFLSRNPPHPSAQVVPSKKIDKHTKEILKKLKDLNKIFDHTENAGSCDYFDINEDKKSQNKRARLFTFRFKHFIIISSYKWIKNTSLSSWHKIWHHCISESRIAKKNSLILTLTFQVIILNKLQPNHQQAHHSCIYHKNYHTGYEKTCWYIALRSWNQFSLSFLFLVNQL